MIKQFDIVIIGGGLVGAITALSLDKLGLSIALVESHHEQHFQASSLDVRSLALAYSSAKILQGMGLWQFLENEATAIQSIHVSDRGHFGFTRLDAKQVKADALGYVVEISALLTTLYKQLNQSGVYRLNPATLLSLDQSHPDQVQMLVQSGEEKLSLNAKILLGADGANSAVRRLLDINFTEYEYKQTAIVSNVALKRPHENMAYERFTKSGPLALLPLSDQRMAVVWTVEEAGAADILQQTDAEFLKNLQLAFGYRAGKFLNVGKRQAHALKQLKANLQYKGRAALIGNSAHSLHPVGAQGFNLSMRDIAGLLSLIAEVVYQKRELDETLFKQYVDLRKRDQTTMSYLTDGLVKLFSTENGFYAVPRNMALRKVERCPPVKFELNKLMMGMRGRLSRLNRGLALEQDTTLL